MRRRLGDLTRSEQASVTLADVGHLSLDDEIELPEPRDEEADRWAS